MFKAFKIKLHFMSNGWRLLNNFIYLLLTSSIVCDGQTGANTSARKLSWWRSGGAGANPGLVRHHI